MKWLKTLLFIIGAGIVAWGIVSLRQQKKVIRLQGDKLEAELDFLTKDNESLNSRIEYLKDPRNLLKEAKSEFNYRAPDEKLIIIIPHSETTVTTTITTTSATSVINATSSR